MFQRFGFPDLRRSDPATAPLRLQLQSLEERTVPAVFTVTNTLDAGQGSLRQAVLDANATSEADEVRFDPSLHGQTIMLETGELAISSALTITGPGADQMTIDGGGQSGILNIDDSQLAELEVNIHGLTITGGMSPFGGGILNFENLSLSEATISGNTAQRGGGILNVGTLAITESTISGNTATAYGGGVYNVSMVTLTDSTLSDNEGTVSGGGLANAGGTAVIAQSIVSGNSAVATRAGGLYNVLDAQMTVIDSTVSGNSASTYGGGIDNFYGSELQVINSTISGNSANLGGGVANVATSTLNLTGSTLAGNSANGDGGGLFNFFRASATLVNATISGNIAGRNGGGITSRGYAAPTAEYVSSVSLTQVTIADNAAVTGGGVFNDELSDLTLANSIIADSQQGGEVAGVGGVSVLGTTLVEDGSVAGVLTGDPQLGMLADNGGPTPTHILLEGSPAIDAGDNALFDDSQPSDQRGQLRIRGSALDLGAIETQLPEQAVTFSATTVRADENLTDGNQLVFSVTRTDNLAAPLDVPADFLGSATPGDYTFAVVGGEQTSSGFRFDAGSAEMILTVTAIDDVSAEADESLIIILGPGPGYAADSAFGIIDRNDFVVTNDADNGEGSLRQAIENSNIFDSVDVVTLDPSFAAGSPRIVLESGPLVITDAMSLSGPGVAQLTIDGAGRSRVLTIDDGLAAELPVNLSGLTITGGSTPFGGGIFNFENLTVTEVNLTGNTATSGGGILNAGTLAIARTTISGNTAEVDGGGLYNSPGSSVTLVNATVSGNIAGGGGGGIASRGYANQYGTLLSTVRLTQVTIADNAAATGGGVFNDELSALTLANSVLADSPEGGDLAGNGEVTLVGINLVEDGSVAGVLTGDPQLGMLADNGGTTPTHMLLEGSPAIDAGDNSQAVNIGGNPLTTDQRGEGFGRLVGVVDLGAIEVQPPTLQIVAFTPTTSGFVVQFSQPIQPDELNLYDANGRFGVPDVTLSGPDGAIRGSLVLSEDRQSFTFVTTGGILPSGNYTVTIRSAVNGVVDEDGNLLDGDADGTPGDDAIRTFDVAAVNAVVVRLPDFARGPGQSVHIPNTHAGLPLRVSNASGVNRVTLSIAHDPMLLDITGATVADGLPTGAEVNVDTTTPGLAVVNFISPTALSGEQVAIVNLTASVPSDVSRGVSQVLSIIGVDINDGTIEGIGAASVHSAAYFGDVNNDGSLTVTDVTESLQLAAGQATGFAEFALVDPRLVGDVDSDGILSVGDVLLTLQAAAGSVVPQIPLIP